MFAQKAVYLHPIAGEAVPSDHTITFTPADTPGAKVYPDWAVRQENNMIAKSFTVRFTNGAATVDERLADHLALHHERVHAAPWKPT